MIRRFASGALVMALVALTSLPGFGLAPQPADASTTTWNQPGSNCPTYKLSARDYGKYAEDGTETDGLAHLQFSANLSVPGIAVGDIYITWQNLTTLVNFLIFRRGTIRSVLFPDPVGSGRIHEDWVVNTGPGDVNFKLNGQTVTLTNGQVCTIPIGRVGAGTNVSGTGTNGITLNGEELPLPLTADLNDDGLADDSHCGNICNKAQDDLLEAEMEKVRQKICQPLQNIQASDANLAFKFCKKSGKLAISQREARGFECWRETNEDWFLGPTAPENAPAYDDGRPYDGFYYGDCGFQVPTVTVPTPAPTPQVGPCTYPPPDFLINCPWSDGEVHALGSEIRPYADTTATPKPTSTPIPSGITVSPTLTTKGGQVTVTWKGDRVASPLDKIVLYLSSGALPSSSNQQSRYTATCGTTAPGVDTTAGKILGSCTFTLPAQLPNGDYKWHLMYDTSAPELVDLALSGTLQIRSNCEVNPNQCSE